MKYLPTYTHILAVFFFFRLLAYGHARRRHGTPKSPTVVGGAGMHYIHEYSVSININTYQNRFPIDVLHSDVKKYRTAQVVLRLLGFGGMGQNG